MKRLGVAFLLLLFPAFLLPKLLLGDVSCTGCHKQLASEFSGSSHKEAGVNCHNCHGGDPRQKDIMAHGTDDFVGKPSREEIPQFCARCHSDRNMMRPYGLPADQLEQYRTSGHGKALFEKHNTDVAVCVDCHGKHKILSKRDPRSSVFLRNVPETCGRCHENRALARKYGLKTDVIDDYFASVHWKAISEKGVQGAPNCATCHGTHGAAPPEVAEVSSVCGSCHINEREGFRESKHREAMDTKKTGECISCHGNHRIASTTYGLYDTVCLECHGKDSGAFQVGQKIKGFLVTMENDFQNVQASIEEAKLKGLEVKEEEAQLTEARTQVLQSQPLTHTVSIEKIGESYEKTRGLIDSIRISLSAKLRSIYMRKIALFVIWGFVLLMVLLIAARRRQLMRETA